MKQIKMLLWFDVEDYVTPESDDAFLRLLVMLDELGIRATIKFCTKKVELLKERGREDIFRYLPNHELCFHTTNHSVHPLPTEYLENYGFREGTEEFYRHEKAGFDWLTALIGQHPASYGHPGVAWAPQAFAAPRYERANLFVRSSHSESERRSVLVRRRVHNEWSGESRSLNARAKSATANEARL